LLLPSHEALTQYYCCYYCYYYYYCYYITTNFLKLGFSDHFQTIFFSFYIPLFILLHSMRGKSDSGHRPAIAPVVLSIVLLEPGLPFSVDTYLIDQDHPLLGIVQTAQTTSSIFTRIIGQISTCIESQNWSHTHRQII
jgi:hypothetical protein